jgi:hypothetical protein
MMAAISSVVPRIMTEQLSRSFDESRPFLTLGY